MRLASLIRIRLCSGSPLLALSLFGLTSKSSRANEFGSEFVSNGVYRRVRGIPLGIGCVNGSSAEVASHRIISHACKDIIEGKLLLQLATQKICHSHSEQPDASFNW
jgi:hypothetical protein